MAPGVELMAFVGKSSKRKASAGGAWKAHDRALVEVGEMLGGGASRGWERATPAHFVALYARLHHDVYGAEPAELRSDAWWGAVSAATKMLAEEFSGDVLRMLDFVKWVWRREREREKRAAKEQAQEARRIGWGLMFRMRHLLTDYRVAGARAGKRVNG